MKLMARNNTPREHTLVAIILGKLLMREPSYQGSSISKPNPLAFGNPVPTCG
jgi:hypothetical protein